MVSTSHYADICITGGGVPQVVGTLLYRIHGFLVRRVEEVAVAFPAYRGGDRPQFGPVLRCFGTVDALDTLLDSLENEPLWIGKRIRSVPPVERHSAFIRRQLPSRVKSTTRNKEYAARRRQEMLQSMRAWPFTFVRSESGQLEFPISLEKRTIDRLPEHNGTPSAYGLSRPSSVLYLPDFS